MASLRPVTTKLRPAPLSPRQLQHHNTPVPGLLLSSIATSQVLQSSLQPTTPTPGHISPGQLLPAAGHADPWSHQSPTHSSLQPIMPPPGHISTGQLLPAADHAAPRSYQPPANSSLQPTMPPPGHISPRPTPPCSRSRRSMVTSAPGLFLSSTEKVPVPPEEHLVLN